MEQAKPVKISCAGCGRQYRWKPELAGKKVRCGCGHVVEVPVTERPPEEPMDDMDADLYALAEDEKRSGRTGAGEESAYRCPSCQQAMEVGAVVCVSCGFNVKLGGRAAPAPMGRAPVMMSAGGAVATAGAMGGSASPILGYAGPNRRAQAAMESGGDNKVLDLWVPLAMLAFGIVGSFARLMYFTDEPESFAMASLIVGLRVCVEVVMLSIGCLIAIKALDVAFGTPGTAALKVAAIAIAPGALAEILTYYLGTGVGWYAAAIISALMYFLLFYYLFDLDLGEVLVLSAIVWLIRTWVGMLLVGALLAMLMSGSGGGSSLGTLAAATTGDGTTSDEEAEHVMEMGWTWEGKAWINDSPGRIIGNMGHAPSVEIIEGFYKAGAEKDGVQIQCDGPAVIMLIVKLPRGKANRKPVIDYANSIAKTHGLKPQDDHGQRYLVYHFMP